MAETVDASLLLSLVKEFDSRGFSTEEYRDSVARAIEKLINRDAIVDDVTLSIVEGWLSSAAVPVADKDTESASVPDEDEDAKEIEEKEGRSILWGMGGLSILPHGNFPILETTALIQVNLAPLRSTNARYVGLRDRLRDLVRGSETASRTRGMVSKISEGFRCRSRLKGYHLTLIHVPPDETRFRAGAKWPGHRRSI